ncbi:MAG: hypothetical protein ABI091_20800 [Ferruginibacter sp.]
MKISEIITEVNTKFGAPMGRYNVGSQPMTITSGNNCRIVKKNQIKVYEKKVPMIDGYDIGGAYWGYPHNIYVRFTKDLSYIEYFRK